MSSPSPKSVSFPPQSLLHTRELSQADPQVSHLQKYTVPSHGIWDKIRRFFAVEPDRSNGIPLNRTFRNPPPGSNDPTQYSDPVTFPAADIADNPYWRRDMRRNFARPSTVTQADVVGLLTVGSAAAPKEGVLLLGEDGGKQLVAVREEGQVGGLAAYFEKGVDMSAGVLGPSGMPPLPASVGELRGTEKKYELMEEQSYQNE